jgi:hypothetical protein
MKELNKIQTAIFLLGGILMAVGAGTTLLAWGSAPYIYTLGAMGFSSMQMLQRYEGQNFVIRRLRRMMLLSDVLFLVSAVLMFVSNHRDWVVSLLVAALLQLYSIHRIGSELEKEAKK